MPMMGAISPLSILKVLDIRRFDDPLACNISPAGSTCCGKSPQGRETLPSSDQVLPQTGKVLLVILSDHRPSGGHGKTSHVLNLRG